MTKIQASYDASSIQVLKGLEAVRRRPGMYVGGTDIKALHHLVYEIVDNSIDEALAGRCDRITVTIHPDESVSVSDNGGGIPVDVHPTEGVSAMQVVLTTLHAGGKFDGSAYKVSGGLHGVGAAAVNALSSWAVATVKKDGAIYQQRYERGIPQGPVARVGKTKKDDTGTTIQFRFDDTIFNDGSTYRFETLLNRFREMAFVTTGIFITLLDERAELLREMSFYFEGGLSSFVRYLNRNRKGLHEPIAARKEVDGVDVELAIQYTDGMAISEFAFANTIHTPDGGTHLTGLRTAVTRVINSYARKNNYLKEKETNFSSDDVREGITAIVSVKHPDPQFESQTKVKLMNAEVAGIVASVTSDALSTFLEENPREAKRIIERCLTSSRARDAARKARELVMRKSALESLTLPGKLADCSERDAARSEMFIVEGDSAGGCFAGDTLVALADGRNLTFKEIVAEQEAGQEHFCYTIRRDGKIGLERIISARRTKVNAEVIKVTLDNGESMICTPDHRFMLRDGRYKQAADLTPHDSLMPLYRKLSDMTEPGITINNYEMVWDPRSENWLFTHLLADWYNRWRSVYTLEQGEHCHHIDFNKYNNNPTNIQRLPAEEHLALHRRHIAETLHRPEVIDKSRQVRQSDEYREMMSERMRRPETRQITLLKFSTFCERYFDGDPNRAYEAVVNYNHRIVAIERLDEAIDVYDIEVPGTHNFALASGVFVHNSAKQGRDRHFQAILPLRGKILNTERARLDKILANNEVKALISALGTGIGESFDLSNLRYSRIVIMTDADVDGSHIRTLLLTFFFRYMPQLIEKGHLYIAQPPLYMVKEGKNTHYTYTEGQNAELLKTLVGKKYGLQRYKGLGEMNPEQLWETTMDPARRTLLQVTIEDAVIADRTFDMLMGSEVAPRRRFITTHASEVRNLDI